HLRFSPLTLQLGLFILLMAPEVYNPLRLLAAHYHDRAAARAAIGEIEAQLGKLPQEATALADIAPLGAGAALGVELAGLTLKTPDGVRTLLAHADLAIAPGEHVAILGSSG